MLKLILIAGLLLGICATFTSGGSASTHTICQYREGVITLNQEPFLPIGYYHVSWAGTDEMKRRVVDAAARSDLNLLHMALDLQDKPILDLAARNNIYLIIINDDPEGLEAMARSFGNHPAVLAWNIADDFGTNDSPHTPESVLARHRAIKTISPEKCTYISSPMTDEISEFVGVSDLMAIQVYPIEEEPLRQPSLDIAESRLLADPYERPLLANVQSFAWENQREPTYAEIRNMTYQTLVSGATGIIFYTYFDPNWNMDEHPVLWTQMKGLITELSQLQELLLTGVYGNLGTAQTPPLAAYWLLDDEGILIIINPESDTVLPLSVRIPFSLSTAPELLFEAAPSPLRYENGTLAGELPPNSVYVFRLAR